MKATIKYWLLKLPLVGNLLGFFLARRLAGQEKKVSVARTNADIFGTIYRDNLWAEGATTKGFYSGSGTTSESAVKYITFLNRFITENGVSSMTDVGCGDFRIGRQITERNPNLIYNGVDVVKDLIASNTENFGNERTRFLCRDASKEDIPPAGLLTIRQVLQHLSNEDISNILRKVNDFKFIIITEHLPKKELIRKFNEDKPSGKSTRVGIGSGVFIDKPPYSIKCAEVLRCDEDKFGDIVSSLIIN